MKKSYIIPTLLVFCLSFGQSSKTKKADYYFDRYDFVAAAKEYAKLIQKDSANFYINKQLALANYNIFNPEESIKWHKKALAIKDDNELRFQLSQMLRASGKHKEADEQMDILATKTPNDSRVKSYVSNKEYLKNIDKQEFAFDLKKLNINSETSDFAPFLTSDKTLYFVSARGVSSKKDVWTKEAFLDIYEVKMNTDGSFENPSKTAGINSDYHDGPIAVSADGKTAYFASESFRSKSFVKDSKKKIKEGFIHIFKAEWKDGSWQNVTPISINGTNFSCSSPALSPDEKTLYFSSDRPGSIGKTDIWSANILPDGSFSEPKNLGPTINTEGKESFPFVSDDGLFYFSSDGHAGFGGYDIFSIQLGKDSKPKNLGKPINSERDDFSFFYSKSNNTGFIASNREKLDNLYQITKNPFSKVVFNVKDDKNSPISDVTISVVDQNNSSAEQVTDNEGNAFFKLNTDKKIKAKISKIGYETEERDISVDDLKNGNIAINLKPILPKIKDKEIEMQEIFFEFNKYNVTKLGASELDKLIVVLNENPSFKIEIAAHADNRGSDKYNLKLSDRRAKSSRQYLISKGIDAGRIEAKGYGESNPKVSCSKCTEEEHALNRRTEFRIIEK